MYPIVTPDIFGSSDVFDQLGQWIGVLGVSCKHLMSEHADADGALTYQFDAEGYPTRIDVSFPEDPSDNCISSRLRVGALIPVIRVKSVRNAARHSGGLRFSASEP